MAGSLALYAENKILDHIVGKTSFTMPGTPFLALFIIAPTHEDGTGGTEASAGNYGRLALTAATYWGTAANAGAISNDAAIEFPEASGASWGEINGFAIYDAETVGNMIVWGDITTPKTILVGDTAKFAIGELDIGID